MITLIFFANSDVMGFILEILNVWVYFDFKYF